MNINPAYVELAHRRAIYGELIAHLIREYTPAYDGEPKKHITSEDLTGPQAEVPAPSVQRVINDLQQQEESMRLELLRFEFVRKGDGKRRQEDQDSAQGRRGRHAQAEGKGRRR